METTDPQKSISYSDITKGIEDLFKNFSKFHKEIADKPVFNEKEDISYREGKLKSLVKHLKGIDKKISKIFLSESYTVKKDDLKHDVFYKKDEKKDEDNKFVQNLFKPIGEDRAEEIYNKFSVLCGKSSESCDEKSKSNLIKGLSGYGEFIVLKSFLLCSVKNLCSLELKKDIMNHDRILQSAEIHHTMFKKVYIDDPQGNHSGIDEIKKAKKSLAQPVAA